jgi:hypothetical protein
VPQDDVEALKWFRSATDQKNGWGYLGVGWVAEFDWHFAGIFPIIEGRSIRSYASVGREFGLDSESE